MIGARKFNNFLTTYILNSPITDPQIADLEDMMSSLELKTKDQSAIGMDPNFEPRIIAVNTKAKIISHVDMGYFLRYPS